MQPVRGPCRILDENPQHDRGKECSRNLDLPDRHWVAFTSYQQRNLVDRNEARKQNSINPPSEQDIAAEPKWTPCQPGDERPQQRVLHDGAFGREAIRPRKPGRRRGSREADPRKIEPANGRRRSPGSHRAPEQRSHRDDGAPNSRHVTTLRVKIRFHPSTDPDPRERGDASVHRSISVL